MIFIKLLTIYICRSFKADIGTRYALPGVILKLCMCAMFPKHIEQQSFALRYCSQVGLRKATWEQYVSRKHLSRCLEGRFCKTRRSQVFWKHGSTLTSLPETEIHLLRRHVIRPDGSGAAASDGSIFIPSGAGADVLHCCMAWS